MSRLTGKTVLVTGGGSGIGLATARALLEEGARVAIAGRTEARLREAAASLGGGDRLLARAADVTDPAQAEALVRAVAERFGPPDILVNNAGANVKERSLAELTPESWRYLVAANLDGAFYCIRAALPEMRRRKEGLIINVNSVAGVRASPLGGPAYSAAKFGLHALALCVAAEERANGVRVSSIYPGEVNTLILEQRPEPVDEAKRRRILQPEDVAAAVRFVATLPPHVCVPELVITPMVQAYL
ncbi:MAG TPA: SDR family oxidoreductase [Gemmataceae bacterium]|nr:SDR family oxidoreductase [Gemmataceae bacterium]